jgi:serine/threonine-protein kinase
MPAPALTEDPFLGLELGHYRIAEKIGSGGMGAVYRARDEHLDREVAIKVLLPGTLADESARKHFRKEALALSKLNHPNIATIFDFDTQQGVDFLAMEYIPGSTLSEKLPAGPLPQKEVLWLGIEVAEGLSAAHEHGVVHRDLKPGNLRLTLDGRLKILDFGLAKLRQPSRESAATESVLESRAITGTLPYMAPEQVLGAEIDARTDIHAAGLVLYEMATGRRPFAELEHLQLMGAILHKSPPPPSTLCPAVSGELERIIGKCLEKEPENRYQSAKELAIDLRRLQAPARAGAAAPVGASRKGRWRTLAAAGTAVFMLAAIAIGFNAGAIRERLAGHRGAPIQSIAVLPLANLSHDPEQEYFADGMTEALITELSQISSLKVISRTSAMHYKGASEPLPQVARELNVDGVVEGSVLRSGDRVRITAQLIYAPSDTHVWAKSYERDMRGVLTLQSEVAQAIASEIRAKVTPEEQTRLASARPVNPEAYELYLKGRYEWNKRTKDGMRRGLDYFQQAIELDPTYSLAYSGVADSYALLGENELISGREVYPKAKAAALKALELDETSAEAHTSFGGVLFDYDRNPQAALKEFETAIRLNPNYATAHHWYATKFAMLGRSEEAYREIEQARRLDPLSERINANVALVLYYGRQYDRAIVAAHRALELEPTNDTAHWYLGHILLQRGTPEMALAEYQEWERLTGSSCFSCLIRVHAAAGNRREALKILDQLKQQSKREYVSPVAFAEAYTALGENDEAMTWLEKGFEDYAGGMDILKAEPAFDRLRSDPRFQDLLRRMNFPR